VDGTVKGYQEINDIEGGFTGVLDDNDRFGSSLASLGDVDGDGVMDLAVGAYGDSDSGASRGAVWVLFLNADGTVQGHQKINDTEGDFTGTLDDVELFGISVSAPGDLDGDQVPDLLVGEQRDDDGGSERGAVWVLFLNANGTVKGHQKISDTEGGFSGTLDDSDHFGTSVASLGDLDGDGTTDLVVGAYQDDDGGENRGAAWILFMNGPPSVAVSVPDTTATYNESLQIPVRADDTTGREIVSAEVFVAYDGDLLTAFSTSTSSTLLTGNWSVETNIVEGVSTSIDTIKIAMATDDDVLVGAGTLINVDFQVADVRMPASSPLTLTHVLFNDGTPGVVAMDGSVTLVGVDGVLTSAPGQVIPRQTITVTAVDADADLDGTPGTDQVTASVASSNGDEETLILDEDAVTAGTFRQTIPTVFGIAENDGNDQIEAQAGDQITFTYTDALAADGTGPVPRTDQTDVVGGTDGTVDVSIASQPGDDVHIKVVDVDISDPPLEYIPAETTIDVDVVNSTTAAVLTVTLNETAGGSGIFVGTLATTSGTEGGKMTSAEEDVLTVTYVDDLTLIGEGQVDRTDDNQVLYPWGDADDNEQLQAYDAALTLLEVIFPSTLSGLPELAVNVDIDPVGTGINPFDASLILQHRVGLITSFPVQDAASTNHPQPNPASPKPIPQERLLALQVHDGYLSVWTGNRSQVLSGDLLMEGAAGQAEMNEDLSDFLLASRPTDEGLRVVFAGAEATEGPGELLRVHGMGASDVRLVRAHLNGGGMAARIGGAAQVAASPSAVTLHPNHPNPFNPETTIRFELPADGLVSLRIYDVTGQVVRELVSTSQMAGTHSVVWNGRNSGGAQVANGLYLYELRVGDYRSIRKMILMK